MDFRGSSRVWREVMSLAGSFAVLWVVVVVVVGDVLTPLFISE
jgi:hypothetical protein